jgi:hypothetical protein
MLSRNTENFKVTYSAKGFYVIEKRERNDCGTFKFAAHVTKQETINNLSVIRYGLHELTLHVPGIIFLPNVRVSTNRTILVSFCGLIWIYLSTLLILQLSVARINDSEFNIIHFPCYSIILIINTCFLPCIIFCWLALRHVPFWRHSPSSGQLL